MKRSIYLAPILLSLTACVTPSTMMVNQSNQIQRCSAYGYGNLMAILTAEAIHDGCVEDLRKIGYIELPTLKLGIDIERDTDPPIVKGVSDPAQAAGVRAGDVVVQIGAVKPKSNYDVWLLLAKNRRKDAVSVEVLRADQPMRFAIVPVER